MTNQEAIETIKTAIAEVEWNYPLEYAVAFEKAIEALEKQVPYPTQNQFVGKCKCGKTVYPHMKYCDVCGQALDWS